MTEVPKGWIKTTFGAIFEQRREYANGDERLLSVTLDQGVIPQELAGRRDISSHDKSLYRKVHPGDIVYNTMRMWQGVSGVSNLRGIVSPAYTVCLPKGGTDPQFIARTLKHPRYVTTFRSYSQGMVSDTWNLPFSSLANISIILPSALAEQRWIAEILDDLDEQITAAEALIKKLQQMRVAAADSFISESSAHFTPLGDLLAESPRNGYSPKGAEDWTGIVALGLGCLTHRGFAPIELKSVPNNDPRIKSALLNEGDLLMSRSNTPDLVGLVGRYRYVGGPCIYPDLMMRLRPRPECNPEFLEFVLRAPRVRRQIQASAQGTSGSMVKINADIVKRLLVPVPSRHDQVHVVARVQA
ncbi:MAG TPA: restriction endonuclease subunit S, partial [Pseudonocardiaceae bacterium]|nr:restriction endonuclease subunit S [Pseudonocardiaceae bacterium]